MKLNVFIVAGFLCMISVISKGQTSVVLENAKDEPVVQSAQTLTNLKTIESSGENTIQKNPYAEGAIPTPEQQGFTKQTIGGKDIYTKEEGALIIQYIPK